VALPSASAEEWMIAFAPVTPFAFGAFALAFGVPFASGMIASRASFQASSLG